MAVRNPINSNYTVTDGTVYWDGTRLVTAATGTAGQVLTSNGVGAAPTYQTSSSFATPTTFMAYITTLQTAVVGANTSTTPILFDTKYYDIGTNYDTATGRFTAPATGIYYFYCNIYMGNLASHVYTGVGVAIGTSNAVGTALCFDIGGTSTTYDSTTGASVLCLPGHITYSLTAGDTVYAAAFANSVGNFQTVTLIGTNGGPHFGCIFGGWRIH